MAVVQPFSRFTTMCCAGGEDPLAEHHVDGEVLHEGERIALLLDEHHAVDVPAADVVGRERVEHDGSSVERLRLRGDAHPDGLAGPGREALLAFVRDRSATADDVSVFPLSAAGPGPIPPIPPLSTQCWTRIPHICNPPTTNCG